MLKNQSFTPTPGSISITKPAADPLDSQSIRDRKARAEAALRRGEFDLAENLLKQENIELDALVENLRIYQAELEIQNAELREAQAISEQALARFSLLFSHLPLAELVIDRTGLILDANTKAATLFALRQTRMRQYFFRRLIEPMAESELARALVQADEVGSSQIDRLNFIAADGGYFPGELHLARLPNEAGEKHQFVCAIIDLSERVQADARIAALAAVVEHSNDIIVVKDLDLRVVATNMAFVRASGHNEVADLLGKTDAEIFNMSPEQEPVRSYMVDERQAQSLPPGEFILREEPVIQSDGKIVYVLTRKYPIHDADGRLIGTGNISVDISTRKHAEELERFSAFQAGIAEMSTSVLHNVGNAITTVIHDAASIGQASLDMLRVADLLDTNAARAAAELACSGVGAGPLAVLLERQTVIQREAARAIRNLGEDALREPSRRLGVSVQHIAEIIRIQQSAALPNRQDSRFSLSQAIQSALEMQGDAFGKRGIKVKLSLDPAVEFVSLSHNLMLQALVNGIRNSIEAIDERGQIESVQGSLRISAEALGDDRLRITLEDNGIGFDAEAHAKLFRFGYTTKPRGSGFGLPSVAVFAQEAGGQVSLHSDGPGKGAILLLELPLHGKSNPAEAGAA